jgi:hypothetical protein
MKKIVSGVIDDVKEVVSDLDEFWFSKKPIEPLVIARIGLGASMFFAYLLYTPFIERLFGSEGLGNYLLGSDFTIRESTWFYYWFTLVSAACFTVGLATPLSGIALILGHLTFIEPGRFFSWGWVPTAPAFIWYLSIGPCGRAFSLDSWISKRFFGHRFATMTPGWSMRLIQVHIIAVYIGASWHRLDDVAWWRGEMVFDAVEYAYYSRFPNVPWSSLKILLVPANYLVWFLELAAPIGLAFKPTRIWFAGSLWAMHLGLELTSTIGWWQCMMMSVLFTYFPSAWSKALLPGDSSKEETAIESLQPAQSQ